MAEIRHFILSDCPPLCGGTSFAFLQIYLFKPLAGFPE